MSKKQLTDEELFQKLSESLGVPVEELQTDYAEIVEEVKKDERFVEANETTINQIARNRFIARKRREASSTAIPWEGIVCGIGDKIDGVFKQRQLTEASFKADPIGTQKGKMYQGRMVLANEKGEPLYPKTPNNDKWNRTGKPLPEHSFFRNIVGTAAPIDKKTKQSGEPRDFTMTLNQARVDLKVPLSKPVKFKGINKTTDEDNKQGFYTIGDSVFTKFEEADLKIPDVETILTNSKRFLSLGELEEFQTKHENDYDRTVITEGTVSLINLEPNAKTGNLRMIIDDETLLFGPQEEGSRPGVTCWIPTDRNIEIDFGQDSRIYVIGQTSRGKKFDPLTGQSTDEPGDVMINVFGIHCPEMFKVKLEPEPLPETALDVVNEPTETSETVEEEAW